MVGNEDDKIPLFNGNDYANWTDAMKFQLKSKGAHVWDAVASKKWYLKNKTKISKDDQKFNSIALQTIKRALSNDVKMRLGKYTFARNLWLNIEDTYQAQYQSAREDTSQKSDEELSKDMLSTEENNLLFASSQSKENIGLDELSNDSCYDDEVLSKEKEEDLLILKDKILITKNEDLKKLKEDFLIAIENTKKKIRFYPINVFDKIENMFMVILSELETVLKINELLHELWMESKNSRRACKSQVDTKN